MNAAPVAIIQRSDETSLALRLNQRLAAEVLKVSGDRAVLAIQGVRVVAKLASAEQAAALIERRFAQFVVRDLAGPVITLQWVQTGPTEPASEAISRFIPHVLHQLGLPQGEASAAIARALLNHGFPVTPELFAGLQAALSGLDGWGPAEAETAAALKALGLPLSSATVALAGSQLPPLGELLSGLRLQLQALLRRRLPHRLVELVKNSLELLDGLVIDVNAQPEALAEKLRQVISLLGRSLEGSLAQQAQGSGRAQPETELSRSLLALAFLRRELSGDAPPTLLENIDRFLDSLRRIQFINAEPQTAPLKDRWLRLDLPLVGLPSGRHEEPGEPPDLQTARLRVAFRMDAGGSGIDAQHTGFAILVQIGPVEAVQVDLSITDRRIGARVAATTKALRQRAESELPSLQAGLEGLGYMFQSARCEVANLSLPAGEEALWDSALDPPPVLDPHHQVNVQA